MIAAAGLEPLVGTRPAILIFLPNTNELQRFVRSGAFEALGADRRLHFVLPADDAEKMLAAASPVITRANSSTIKVPPERVRKWTEVFKAGCVHYAHMSPSFAIREGLEVNPAWHDTWEPGGEECDAIDRAFDARVEAMLDGLRPLQDIVDLFDRFTPVCCIVPTSFLDLFCNEVTWACAADQVACLLLQSGWDNLSSKGLVYGRTPFMGCWGPQSREHAMVLQRLWHKRTALLWAPHYEFLRPAPAEDVTRLRAALGAADDEQLVLFGGSFRQFDETSTLRELDRAIARGRLGRLKIVYRPHPWRAARKHERSFFKYEWSHVVFDPGMRNRYLREQEEPGYLKRHAPMFDMAYLSTLISASDAVISPMSTLLVEALILEKPTMAIAFGDGNHRYSPDVTAQTTHMCELRGSSALIWCDNRGKLVKEVARLLKPRWDAKHARARQALLERIVTREPGTYAERLAEFCRSRVESHGRKWRAQRAGVKRDTISHSYGAHLIARTYCGISDGESIVPGYWMHGWVPAYHGVHPALIALHKKEGQHDGYDFVAQIRDDKARIPQWVSRPDQVEFLTAQDYQHVKAIGLPIAYLPAPDVRRVPGSLLVLPPHSHRTHGPEDPLAEQYADAIASLRNRFEHVWVGITEDDIAGQQWVESFRRRGIDVLPTTDQGGPNTLARLQRLLSTFEYVTTNGFGSHIALAAYCGAKVSVYGPYAEFPLERLKATYAIKVFPELLEQAHYLCTERALREHYPFLFVGPDQADVRRVVVTGAQCFDQWFDRAPSRNRASFCGTLGLRPDRPYVLYVCSALFLGSPPEAPFVLEWIRRIRTSGIPGLCDVQILVRPHPSRTREWEGVDVESFGGVVVHGNSPVDASSRADYFDAHFHSGAIVGVNTSAFIEGGIVGRPVHTILLPELSVNQAGTLHFRYLLEIEGGLLEVARDFDEHVRQLAASLACPVSRVRPFIRAFVRPHGLDVPATPLFVRVVEELEGVPVAVPASKWAAPLSRRVLASVIRRRADRRAERWLHSERELEVIVRNRRVREQKEERTAQERAASDAARQAKRAARELEWARHRAARDAEKKAARDGEHKAVGPAR